MSLNRTGIYICFVFLFRDPSETLQPPAVPKEKPTCLPTNTVRPNSELLDTKKESSSLAELPSPKADFKTKGVLEKHKEAARRFKNLMSAVKVVGSSVFKPSPTAHEPLESKGARPKTKRHDGPEDGKRFKPPVRKALRSPPSRTDLVGRHRRRGKVETLDRDDDGESGVSGEVERNGGEGGNKLQTILRPRALKGEGQLERDEMAFQESLELKGEQKEEVELRSLGEDYLVGKTLEFCLTLLPLLPR